LVCDAVWLGVNAPDGEARAVVDRLAMEPHPEGGWFVRTWTAPDTDDNGRGSGSSILYLLDEGVTSRWHRIDAAELWHHAGGAPLELSWWSEDSTTQRALLGPRVAQGDAPQVVIQPDVWQSARSLGTWSLVTCVVIPEFRFEGFEMAPEGWEPPS
jgi:uncharacterized protein